MRWVLRDVTVLLWVALSIAYGTTHTDYAQFARAYLPSLSVAILGLITYPMTVALLISELFRRRRSWLHLTY